VLQIAEKRLSIGARPGNATISLSFALVSISLAYVARALGIPQASISGTRLPFNNNIATTAIDGLAVTGLLKDGSTIEFRVWGCSQTVQAALVMAATGTPSIPLVLRPGSGLQVLNYT
jgi:hypothetical protein